MCQFFSTLKFFLTSANVLYFFMSLLYRGSLAKEEPGSADDAEGDSDDSANNDFEHTLLYLSSLQLNWFVEHIAPLLGFSEGHAEV